MGKMSLMHFWRSPEGRSGVDDFTLIYDTRHQDLSHHGFSSTGSSSTEVRVRTNALGKLVKWSNGSYVDQAIGMPQFHCSPAAPNCTWDRLMNWNVKQVDMKDVLPHIELKQRVNLCEVDNGGCQVHCEQSGWGVNCSCPYGYKLNWDKKTCSGIYYKNLVLTSTSGTIKSTNYPNNYDNNEDHAWLLVAPLGHQIILEADAFRSEDCCDRVEIYDKFVSSYGMLGRFHGTSYNSSTVSSGNTMLIRFHTDGSQVYSGFSFRYRAVPSCKVRNGGCQVHCAEQSGAVVCSCPTGYLLNADKKTCTGVSSDNYVITADSGSIQSPNYPRNYNNGLRLSWLIVAPMYHQITLDVESFKTESCCDPVDIYDRHLSDSYKLSRFTGTSFSKSVQSSSNVMLITFRSDSSIPYKGFSFNFQSEHLCKINNGGCQVNCVESGWSVNCSCPIGYTLNSDKKTCTGQSSYSYLLTSSSGNIQSPNYPSNYNHNQFIRWLVVVPLGHRIILEVEAFRTESYHDPVEIFDTISNNITRLAKFDGTTYISPLKSSGNVILITFRTDGSAIYPGFSFKYHSEPIDHHPVLALTSSSGSLRSLPFAPQSASLCLSAVYKVDPVNEMWVSANNRLNLTRTSVYQVGAWQIGRFMGTLPPEDLGIPVTLSAHFTGADSSVFSIIGCNPYDEGEDVYTITGPTGSKTPTPDLLPINSTTVSSRRCLNGGVYLYKTKECVCPAGFMGPDCKEACGPNSYGLDCKGTCSAFERGCLNMIFCKDHLPCMCAPGFTGQTCSSKCSSGYYGPSCRIPCGNCGSGDCNIYTGECEEGCKPGYYPPLCQHTYNTLYEPPQVRSKAPNWAVIAADTTLVVGRGTTKFYQVQYRDRYSSTWLEQNPQKLVGVEITANITELKAAGQFAARLILIDIDGNKNQEIGVPIIEFNTPCLVPTSSDYQLKTTSVTSSSFEISWKYEIVNSTWCPLGSFEVVFSDRWKEFKKQVNSDVNVAQFSSLLPARMYSVRIRAYTSAGYAPSSSILSVSTQDHAPGRVTNLQVSNKGPGEQLVTWDKPRFPGGTIQLYYVEYQCLHLLACPLSCRDSAGHLEVSGESVILKELHPHSHYKIKVAAMAASRGPYTTVYAGVPHTAAGVAPEASAEPIIHRSNTSIAVQWEAPSNCSWINGYLYGYRYELVTNSVSDKHTVRSGSTQDTRVNFTDLTPHTPYVVDIYVETSGGWSPVHNLAIPVVTKASVADQVQNLTAYKRGRRMIGVRWAAPVEIDDALKSFTISHRRKDRPPSMDVKITQDPEHCVAWPDLYCYTINGLIQDTDYIVSVQARNLDIDVDGPPVSVLASTRESAPGEPTSLQIVHRTPTTMEVEWGPPTMINGVLRSFIVNVEEIDTLNSAECCEYYPIQELLVTDEEQLYRLEVTSLHPASTVAISVTAKTMSLGTSVQLTAHTPPLPPSLVHPPELQPRTSKDKLVSVYLQPSDTHPTLQSTYLLLILSAQDLPDPDVWDKHLLTDLKEAVNSSFYLVAEFPTETLVGEQKVILGTGAAAKNGVLGVLRDPALSPGLYRVGLALVLEYCTSKSVGFASSEVFEITEEPLPQ